MARLLAQLAIHLIQYFEIEKIHSDQNNFLLQAERILDGLEGKECDLATLEEAKLNLKVVFAAKQSWLEKKIILIE